MNAKIQGKIAQIKQMSMQAGNTHSYTYHQDNRRKDALSEAIHTKKDADDLIAERKAIRKNEE